MENKRDFDELQKDLADCKVQLEAKESLFMQTLLKLEYYRKMAEELSMLMKISSYTRRAELAAVRESKLKAVEQPELMENAINTGREKVSELLENVSELNETIAQLKLAASELEKEKSVLLSEKEAEIDLARTTAVQEQEQLEEMQK
ncbi:hypothetical protein RJ641_009379 [Dillenia turbinata]|uniref:Uncharacterized protein n=1 Tax=Dillenia turbinata TaxID=194707 RepID=A0AAN8Z952_9MAGN